MKREVRRRERSDRHTHIHTYSVSERWRRGEGVRGR